MLLWLFNGTHTHTHTQSHSPQSICSTLFCRATQSLQIHTFQNIMLFMCQNVCVLSHTQHHQGTELLCLQITIIPLSLQDRRGSLVKKKNLTLSALLQPTSTTSCSPTAPPPLANGFCQLHNLAGREHWYKSAESRLPIAETAEPGKSNSTKPVGDYRGVGRKTQMNRITKQAL